MLDDLRVKDVCVNIDDYPNISLHAPIGHAFNIMHHKQQDDKNKYRTILVMDDDDHIKGYLSIRDLIRAVGPEYLHKQQPDVKGHQPFSGFIDQDLTSLSLLWQDGFTVKLHEDLSKPVADYMTLMTDMVTQDDPITKCLYIMLFRDVLVLPVLENDKVVAVIRLIDIFDRIADNVEEVWLPKQN